MDDTDRYLEPEPSYLALSLAWTVGFLFMGFLLLTVPHHVSKVLGLFLIALSIIAFIVSVYYLHHPDKAFKHHHHRGKPFEHDTKSDQT